MFLGGGSAQQHTVSPSALVKKRQFCIDSPQTLCQAPAEPHGHYRPPGAKVRGDLRWHGFPSPAPTTAAGWCTALVRHQPLPGHGLKQSACLELSELSSNTPLHINRYDTRDDRCAPGHLNQASHAVKDMPRVGAAARSSTPSSTHGAEKLLS